MTEKKGLTRRDFLKLAGVGLGLAVTPDWLDRLEHGGDDEEVAGWLARVEEEDFQQILKLIRACREVIDEEEWAGWQGDMLDCEDSEQALNLCYSFLLESGVDPEEHLAKQDILKSS